MIMDGRRRMDKFAEIKERLARELKMTELDENRNLRDLGLDSLDVVELLLKLEDDYGVHFDDMDIQVFKTVGDVLKSIKAQIEGK